MHTTQAPFLEDLCLLLIFRDAHLENLKVNLMRLYDPGVAKVYICVSQKLNFLTRAKALREIRNVFHRSDIYINNVTDAQLKLVAFYSHYYTGSEPCESTNAPSLNRSSKAGRSDATYKTTRTTKSTPISAGTCAEIGSSSVQATR